MALSAAGGIRPGVYAGFEGSPDSQFSPGQMCQPRFNGAPARADAAAIAPGNLKQARERLVVTHKSATVVCPGGTFDSSPAVHCWGYGQSRDFVSRRDARTRHLMARFNRPYGTNERFPQFLTQR
jgi:hypothetical protein